MCGLVCNREIAGKVGQLYMKQCQGKKWRLCKTFALFSSVWMGQGTSPETGVNFSLFKHMNLLCWFVIKMQEFDYTRNMFFFFFQCTTQLIVRLPWKLMSLLTAAAPSPAIVSPLSPLSPSLHGCLMGCLKPPWDKSCMRSMEPPSVGPAAGEWPLRPGAGLRSGCTAVPPWNRFAILFSIQGQ